MGDLRCFKVEALLQNVLGYPRLPSKLKDALRSMQRDVGDITQVVEELSAHLGKEITMHCVRKEPWVLAEDFNVIVSRLEYMQTMLQVSPTEMYTLVRKCPRLLIIDSSKLQSRYNALPGLTKFGPSQIHKMVHKYPPVLAFTTEYLQATLVRLRDLAFTRELWQEDLENITPSLFAFFINDAEDLLLRLEYLATTGQLPALHMRDIFKVSDQGFIRKAGPTYRKWLRSVKSKRMKSRLREAAEGRSS